MGKSIELWLKRPFFIYSFGLFFLIYKTTDYFPSFQPFVFLGLFSGYCLINYIIISIQKKAGFHDYGVGWLLIIWIISFFVNPIVIYLNTLVDLSSIRLRYLLFFVLIICFLVTLLAKKAGERYLHILNQLVNVFVLVLIGLILINGITTRHDEEKHAAVITDKKLPSLKIKGNKDIIWLLLDEYASPSSLKSQFNFKDPLVDSLKNRNFYVFDKLRSRSDVTLYSLNSLFNLDDSIPAKSYMYAGNYLKNSIWVKHMEKQGYQFISLDFLTIGGHQKSADLQIFPDSYLEQISSNSILTYFDAINARGKKPFDDYNLQTIKTLANTIKVKYPGPTFIWAHLLLPHPPFYRDAAGNLNKKPVENIQMASSAEITKQYTSYLSYGNKIILKTLNEIPDWRNKIIIISGDHGARMLISADDPRRKQPFGAIYYPGMDTKELATIKYVQQIPFHLH